MTAPESVAEAREVDVVVRDLQDVYGALTPDAHRHDIDGMAYAVERAIRYLQKTEPRTPVPTAAHYAALKEAREALRALVTAVTFADPPKLFNGVICHEARVPVEFIDNARAALEQSK